MIINPAPIFLVKVITPKTIAPKRRILGKTINP